MGTAEILIVFSALMALIAVVTIGLDWIGKPLKNRRFIPRMYRFDDEKLPVDAYGHPALPTTNAGSPMLSPAPVIHVQPPPVVVAQVAPSAPQQVDNQPNATVQVATGQAATEHAPSAPAVSAAVPSVATASVATPSTLAAPVVGAAAVSRSAFSDSLAKPEPSHDATGHSDLASTGPVPHSTIAGTAPTNLSEPAASTSWRPGMPLDTTVDDRKPNLATKAERFWMTTAESVDDSHFDDEDVARMASGRAPRRTNPRTGRAEAMQLTGLRQASSHTEVRMRWPDESVDPWNAS